MQRAVKGLIVLFAFCVPWEYSLDLGEPWGNVARMVGLALLLVALPATLARGSLRNPEALQWLTTALFLWFFCTAFWSRDLAETLVRLRGYAQVMAIVWIAWECVETPEELRGLLRAILLGSWVLALLTVADALGLYGADAAQTRFAAVGQDPNDVARFLDFAFPLAALLMTWENKRLWRIAAIGYFPLGFIAVLLTASRGGFLSAVVAFAGCGILFVRYPFRGMIWIGLAMPVIATVLWIAMPEATLERLATIPAQLAGGDMNQRLNIWEAGWRAFVRAPVLGSGAGNFVATSGVAEGDTAHNTALALAVEDGMVGVGLMTVILALLLRDAWSLAGSLRIALLSFLAVWGTSSLAGTLAESRMTWLMFSMITVASRMRRAGALLPGELAHDGGLWVGSPRPARFAPQRWTMMSSEGAGGPE
jgi:hypothetical protein